MTASAPPASESHPSRIHGWFSRESGVGWSSTRGDTARGTRRDARSREGCDGGVAVADILARAGEGALGHTELLGSPSGRLGRSKSLGPAAVRERSLLAARLGPAARLSSAALEGAGNAVGAPSERPSEGYGAENVLRALGGALGRTNTMIVEVGPEGGLEAELFSLRERAARLGDLLETCPEATVGRGTEREEEPAPETL